jgi:hypothetical protein
METENDSLQDWHTSPSSADRVAHSVFLVLSHLGAIRLLLSNPVSCVEGVLLWCRVEWVCNIMHSSTAITRLPWVITGLYDAYFSLSGYIETGFLLIAYFTLLKRAFTSTCFTVKNKFTYSLFIYRKTMSISFMKRGHFMVRNKVWARRNVHQYISPCSDVLNLMREITYTAKPRFTNTSDHEQFGLRIIFPNTKRLGWQLCLELRTRKPSTSWSDKLGVSASAVFVEEWSRGK